MPGPRKSYQAQATENQLKDIIKQFNGPSGQFILHHRIGHPSPGVPGQSERECLKESDWAADWVPQEREREMVPARQLWEESGAGVLRSTPFLHLPAGPVKMQVTTEELEAWCPAACASVSLAATQVDQQLNTVLMSLLPVVSTAVQGLVYTVNNHQGITSFKASANLWVAEVNFPGGGKSTVCGLMKSVFKYCEAVRACYACVLTPAAVLRVCASYPT
jgi:hypothetical protein